MQKIIRKKSKKDTKPIRIKNYKFYEECSLILRSVMTCKSTLRKEVYKKRDPKRYLAILSQVLKYREYYDEIIKKLNFKTKNIYLSLLYVHEIINDKFELENYVTKSVKKLAKNYIFEKDFRIVYVRLNTLIGNISDLYNLVNEVAIENKNVIERCDISKKDKNDEVSEKENFVEISENDVTEIEKTNEIVRNSSNQDDIKDFDVKLDENLSSKCDFKFRELKETFDEKNNKKRDSTLKQDISEFKNNGLLQENLENPFDITMINSDKIIDENLKKSINNVDEIYNERNELSTLSEDDDVDFFRENEKIIEKTILKNIYKLKIDFKLYNRSAYKEGKIIIQNFSSCLPALILNPHQNSTVIDSCAAPGNKTSHLAMIMNNTGKILAYEKSKERFDLLKQMIKKHGVKNTKTFNEDFLETDSETKDIDYILVDPSCSGSGIHDDYTKDHERIEKLSDFQKKILLHAMRFNGTKAVVYSTCSVHEEENEEVVKFVLERNSNFILKKIDMPILKKSTSGYEFGDQVFRCEKDTANNIQGFFVAHFIRKP